MALESVHWQNDSVQIIASASDLKSMDEFLLKKVFRPLSSFDCGMLVYQDMPPKVCKLEGLFLYQKCANHRICLSQTG